MSQCLIVCLQIGLSHISAHSFQLQIPLGSSRGRFSRETLTHIYTLPLEAGYVTFSHFVTPSATLWRLHQSSQLRHVLSRGLNRDMHKFGPLFLCALA